MMETAEGTWQPFDSQEKCSVMFVVKEKEIMQKQGGEEMVWAAAEQ